MNMLDCLLGGIDHCTSMGDGRKRYGGKGTTT